jgi:hypothetical protein
MMDESASPGGPAAGAASAPSLPAAVDRAAFQAELDRLRVRERVHAREGDAIAAARRRLPVAGLTWQSGHWRALSCSRAGRTGRPRAAR